MITRNFDIVVVGAGMVGTCLAVALAEAGTRVGLIERSRISHLAAPGHDGRGSAIAAGSQRILDLLGWWQHLAPEAEAIREIRIADGPSTMFLHFDHAELGEGPMGWIVENSVIRRCFASGLAESDVTIMDGVQPIRYGFGEHLAEIELDDGAVLGCRLVVAADGRESSARSAAGIQVVKWSYPQTAIVCSVEHELPHNGIAHEHFLQPGPFAILPMTENRSSIVWTEAADRAPAILSLGEAEFAEQLRGRFGDFLGEVGPTGGRWHYPLGALYALRCAGNRLMLAGDSAHSIHPIAGQGYNLGLRDVAALAEVVVDSMRLGLDPGNTLATGRYERWRRFDNMKMLAATDSLNRLFSNDNTVLKLARDLGLAAVDQVGPLKRLLMREAMGVRGPLPRLARGQPL